MDRLPMPSAMPAELAEKLSDVSHSPEPFDEYLDEHLRAIVPAELVAPLQTLLLTLRSINQVERVVEALNQDRALKWLRRDVEALREACERAWRDL